ncbi:hypothetical protein [Sulfitobacter sp. JL08]|jgi:hypothetical protein|uniref:hypothetical protein n=1 Tax=unclassified Sulfitobacter TaxID=196795 RepID=UPI0013B3A168|nr:hypothetical protein [Sulfitobacter sp. JL08]
MFIEDSPGLIAAFKRLCLSLGAVVRLLCDYSTASGENLCLPVIPTQKAPPINIFSHDPREFEECVFRYRKPEIGLFNMKSCICRAIAPVFVGNVNAFGPTGMSQLALSRVAI